MIIHSAKELGSLVRSERKRRGWSQRELAEQVGLSPLWISNFERGKSTAHVGLVLRTLKALDVKLRVGEEDKKEHSPTVTADLNSLLSGLNKAMKLPEIKLPKIPKPDVPQMPKIQDKISQKPSKLKSHERNP